MNDDYSELIEYLDKKFQETATKEDLENLTAALATREELYSVRDELKKDIQGYSRFKREV